MEIVGIRKKDGKKPTFGETGKTLTQVLTV